MSAETYAGDIDCQRAWDLLKQESGSVLLDVRTKPEWRYVGVPDLSLVGKEPVFIEWQAYPDLQLNGHFAAEVEGRGIGKDVAVLLLCRSGARSRAAAIALTKLGFRRCYNVADGFEGPKDAEGHRGAAGGWKAAGLPWQQN